MKEYTDKDCVKDLKVLRSFYRTEYGAEPVCLGYAIDRLEMLSKYISLQYYGETRKE